MREFKSDPAVAERENRVVAILVLLGTPLVLLLLRGERDPLVLASFGVGGAVISYLFYRWRDHRSRVSVLRFDETGLEALGGRAAFRLRWADVRAARRTSYGGAQWAIQGAAARWHVLRLDGFTTEQVMEIDALIAGHADAARRARGDAGAGRAAG